MDADRRERDSHRGWWERSHYAEVLRLKGWMSILRGEPELATATLHEAIAVARDQGAKSWELRAATTLARLLASRGDQAEALGEVVSDPSR